MRFFSISFAPVRFLLGAALLAGFALPAAHAEQKSIGRVKLMPNRPQPYVMRDWQKVARDYDAIVFDYSAKGQFLPLIRPDQRHRNYPGESFALVTYIGSNSIEHQWMGGEAINGMAAVVGASLVGIDKTNQDGHNFVLMTQKWFNSENSELVYLNTSQSHTGETFWYELFPNILAYQLNDLYPKTGQLPQHTVSIADRYYEASVGLGGRMEPWTLPEYDYKSYNLLTRKPTQTNEWREPDGAAGIAWLEYMAWAKHRNPKYLAAAEWGMEYLSRRKKSPYYEMLLPYGAYLAARMNAEQGSHYDVEKILNWIFDGNSECRPGWGVVAERWGNVDAQGLVGSLTDGDGYAFAMNGFQQAGALVPLVRYDKRFAHDIGKWMLNLANASRLYYANAHDPQHQSSWIWANSYDKNFAIPYEGLRRRKQGYALPLSDYRLGQGKIVAGNYKSAEYSNDGDVETIEETVQGNQQALEHTWDFDLPSGKGRALLIAAEVAFAGGNKANSFRLSLASQAEGPYTEALTIARTSDYWYQIPDDLHGRIYIKAGSTDRTVRLGGLDRLSIDSMRVGYPTDVSPYAQGDETTGKRPESTTDFSLYSGSHVGILGGIVRPTNVEMLLRLDLLKTDYYHAQAYPSYLYYNPYDTAKSVPIEAGPASTDVYDTVTGRFVLRSSTGRKTVAIPADTAMVLVFTPAGGKLTHEQGRTLVNGVVIDYGEPR